MSQRQCLPAISNATVCPSVATIDRIERKSRSLNRSLGRGAERGGQPGVIECSRARAFGWVDEHELAAPECIDAIPETAIRQPVGPHTAAQHELRGVVTHELFRTLIIGAGIGARLGPARQGQAGKQTKNNGSLGTHGMPHVDIQGAREAMRGLPGRVLLVHVRHVSGLHIARVDKHLPAEGDFVTLGQFPNALFLLGIEGVAARDGFRANRP